MLLILVITSLTMQIAAAVLALRLIKFTGMHRAWILIALAASGQAVRRFLVFHELMVPGTMETSHYLWEEIVGLGISALMLIGIALIAPLFAGIQRSRGILQASEARYRAVFEQSKDGIMVTSPGGEIEDLNQSALDLLGYDRQEMLNQNLEELIDDPGERAAFQQAVETGGWRPNQEVRLRHKSGNWVACEISVATRRTPDGAAVGFQMFVRDITLRKQSEQILKEREETLSAILAASPVGIALIRKRRLVWVNQALQDMLGYSPDELLGKSIRIFYNDEQEYERLRRRAMPPLEKGGKVALDTRWTDKNGVVLDVYLQVQPIAPSGLEKGIIITVTDITQRKRADAALRRSEEQSRLVLDHAMEAIFVVQDGLLKFSNPKTMKTFQYSQQEIKETPFLSFFHPMDAEAARSMYEKNLKGEFATGEGPIRVLTKTGGFLWMEMNSTPITWEDKPAALYFVRDLTEQKKLERQLWLAQKMEAVGRLAGGVAHDFNNLLLVINGQSELALKGLDQKHPLSAKIQAIREAGEKAAALTRQLLTISRRQPVDYRPLHLNQLVAGMEQFLRRLIGEDISIRIDLQKDLWPITADQAQMEQIVMNLAVNARDAMPLGGALTIEASNVFVHADQRIDLPAGAYVLLAVSDNGCGMDSQTVSRIFEPFFTTKAQDKGTGLGLSTVYGIVKQMKGEILVYSEQGQGTTFKIYLPIGEAAVESPKIEPEILAPTGCSEGTLLVVEDNDEVRSLVQESLEMEGYRVLATASTEDALNIAKNHPEPIPLLISDVIMPKMNGIQLINKIKPLRPEMRFILMSGYTEKVVTSENLLNQGTLFLQKPFTLAALGEKVRLSLEHLNAKQICLGK